MDSTDETPKLFHQEHTLKKDDITIFDQKGKYPEFQEALDYERELYQDLADALPLGIYRLRVFHEAGISVDRWSSKDNAPYQIEFINDRLNELLGIDKAAFINNPAIINNYIFEDDKPAFIRKNVEANTYTTPFVWEGRFIGNGSATWVHFESIPRVLENGDILWTGFFEDISERKRAEEELHQKNKELELLNAEKDKFLSIIAHDLKSPFNSILGFSGILLEKFYQGDFIAASDYCEIIRNSSQKAMNLLQNLVLWSQSQTGRMDFKPEYFDLGELTDEIIQLYENIAAQKSICITKDISDTLMIFADKPMIATVIRNLVSNAVKFTPAGGSVQVTAIALADRVTISVSDSGTGMEQAVIDKLFHIDTSYSFPDTNGEKGTGLGLLLCKEFIDKHNGTIVITSEPGKGSVFKVDIPVKEGLWEKQ